MNETQSFTLLLCFLSIWIKGDCENILSPSISSNEILQQSRDYAEFQKQEIKKHKIPFNVNPKRKVPLKRGINGGFPCAACSVLLGMGEQLADINNGTVFSGLDILCSYLPSDIGSQCSILIHVFGPSLIDYFNYGTSPDEICYSVGLCVDEKKQGMCHLFPPPKPRSSSIRKLPDLSPEQLKSLEHLLIKLFPWICWIPGVKQICEAFDHAFHQILPALDVDGDGHSPIENLRGSIWRGKDCHDGNAEIHPGRRPYEGDILVDSNCNGISGVNFWSGLSYEEELCGASGSRGIVYIGDSVGGHFHVPPQWFSPMDMNAEMFTNLTDVISNEADWPDVGFATGFRNSTMPSLINGVTDSIYLRLRERNRCNHRDYHNLARNGANSNDTLFYMKALGRKPRDLPAILFYSLIGNDVCTGKETLEDMTSPDVFYNNTMTALNFFETHLAPESHVILVGLIDAGFLWDAMANRYHPLGRYRKNIKYKDMYNWFNCMEIGPCAGWMNSNKTKRAITSKQALQLNKVLKDIASRKKFDKFDTHYVENPFKEVLDAWVSKGGEIHELIEPVDSLHPTQAAQALIAQQFWSKLEETMPHVLGPVNPNNQQIEQLFGDQGGH